MLRLKTAVLLVALLAVAACGYVEGNYPAPKVKPPELPDAWKNSQGVDMVMVWDRAPESRGFFVTWVDMQEFLPMVEMGAEAGDRRAAAVLDVMKEIEAEGLTVFNLALFMAKGTEIRATKGRFTVEFTDGTAVADEGIAFLEDHKKGPRLHSTRSSAQTIAAKYAEPGKPLGISFAVPAQYATKTVRNIRLR